jgi:hypothetical protein
MLLEAFLSSHVSNYKYNTTSIKSVRAMWKVLMVQNCDNDILEGLVVADPPKNSKSIVS